jgi:hypothetical protein
MYQPQHTQYTQFGAAQPAPVYVAGSQPVYVQQAAPAAAYAAPAQPIVYAASAPPAGYFAAPTAYLTFGAASAGAAAASVSAPISYVETKQEKPVHSAIRIALICQVRSPHAATPR